MANTWEEQAKQHVYNHVLSEVVGHATRKATLLEHLHHRLNSTAKASNDPSLSESVRPSKNTGDKGANRKLKQELSRELERFALSADGKRLPYRLELSAGRDWSLRFVDQHASVKRFWKPYLDSGLPVLIVYTEPLFWRRNAPPAHSYFIRHQDVNLGSSETDIRDKCAFLPEEDPLITSHHFVSSGEIGCIVDLITWFERNGLATRCAVSHTDWEGWIEEHPSNLILIGNFRTFEEIASLQQEHNFDLRIRDHGFKDLALKSEKEFDYPDVWGSTLPALGTVSRMFSSKHNAWTTIFASNHGRHFGGLSRFLTRPDKIAEVFTALQLAADSGLPPQFEFLSQIVVSETGPAKTTAKIEVVEKRPRGVWTTNVQ